MKDVCEWKDGKRTYCKKAASELPSIDDNYCRFCGEFIRDVETLTCNSECGMRMKYGVSCAIHDCKYIKKPEPPEPLIVESGKLHNMKLHELLPTKDFHVIRVPSGWIYYAWDYEKDDRQPLESFCIGIGDGTNNFVCLEPEVRKLEQDHREAIKLLEALKCCGNCRHERDGATTCGLLSKGYNQKDCKYEVLKEMEL